MKYILLTIIAFAVAASSWAGGPKVFAVWIDDNGKHGIRFGCEDSGVVVKTLPASATPLADAYKALFAMGKHPKSHLYNAIPASRLTFVSASVSRGTATIKLKGPIALSGICEDARLHWQLRAAATQFPTIRKVRILVDGKPIEEYLNES